MRKTLIGILIMTVAIMMTLSGAVLAATTVDVKASKAEVTEGENVTVTLSHPGMYGINYVVTYNPEVLEYVKGSKEKVLEPGKVQVSDFGDGVNLEEIPSHTVTFKAKATGESAVTATNIQLSDNKAKDIADITATTATVKVVAATTENDGTEGKATQENGSEENGSQENGSEGKTDPDAPKKSLKDAKTGFDAMYVVYLAAAVLVAGGIVTVARKK